MVEAIRSAGRPIGPKEIAESEGVESPYGSVQQILSDLVASNVLHKPRRGVYQVVGERGSLDLSPEGQQQSLARFMSTQAEAGSPVILPDGRHVWYVFRSENGTPLRGYTWDGESVPLGTAYGTAEVVKTGG
ncbi:MAG: hypothetical protein AAF845_05650 [Bacteroidota bacterium]